MPTTEKPNTIDPLQRLDEVTFRLNAVTRMLSGHDCEARRDEAINRRDVRIVVEELERIRFMVDQATEALGSEKAKA